MQVVHVIAQSFYLNKPEPSTCKFPALAKEKECRYRMTTTVVTVQQGTARSLETEIPRRSEYGTQEIRRSPTSTRRPFSWPKSPRNVETDPEELGSPVQP